MRVGWSQAREGQEPAEVLGTGLRLEDPTLAGLSVEHEIQVA